MENIFLKTNILIACILLAFFKLDAQQNTPPFLLHWSEKDGLSDNVITCMIQDENGFLWLGTSSGLCRFDGKEFDIYRRDVSDPFSIGGNEITSLLELENGDILIGTRRNGLSVFNYQQKIFNVFKSGDTSALQLSQDNIAHLFKTKNNAIVVGYKAAPGSKNGGLSIVSSDFKNSESFLENVKEPNGNFLQANAILQDSADENIFWIGGRHFFKWNKKTNNIQEFPHPELNGIYSYNRGIINLSDSLLLVDLEGLWTFNKNNNKWSPKIIDKTIKKIFRLFGNEIWTLDEQGIGKYNIKKNKIEYEIFLTGEQSPFPKATEIYDLKTIEGNLWICTNFGLYCWIKSFQQFKPGTIELKKESYAYFPEFIGKSSSDNWFFLDRATGFL